MRIHLKKLPFWFWIPFFFLLATTVFAVWQIASRTEIKYLSFYNHQEFPITLKINNIDYQLDSFEGKALVIPSTSELQVDAYSSDNQLFKTFTFPDLNTHQQLVGYVFSKNEDMCFYSAELTAFAKNGTIENYTRLNLTTVQNNTFVYTMNMDQNIYLFPGKVLTNEIIERSKSKGLVGIYPIKCDELENVEQLAQNTRMFLNYDPDAQRKYYFDKKTAIESSSNLDELNNI
jgi:hypothetical protein